MLIKEKEIGILVTAEYLVKSGIIISFLQAEYLVTGKCGIIISILQAEYLGAAFLLFSFRRNI